MSEWEDRLSLVDELLPDWMKKKHITETTPRDCYEFLVKNKVYEDNSDQPKSKAFIEDLRNLESTHVLSNLEICNLKQDEWLINLINTSIQTFEEEDYLDRKKVAEKFTSIIFSDSIKYKDHNGLVVALDSSWGTGKTHFIKKWQLLLGEEYKNHKIKSVYYNAWENDDYENALIPIISDIYKCSDESAVREIAKKTGKVSVTILGVAARQLLRFGTGIDTKEIADEIQEAVENSVFEEYTKHNNNKLVFRKTLAKLPKVKEKIIVFIDELDRCRPQFAIETLEAIKHYMNVDNFIFIFSIDMEQLSHSVATLYGQNMDSSGYLARFFDIQFRLPTPKIRDYLNLMAEKLDVYSIKEVASILENIYYVLKLSLRDINHIYNNVYLFLSIYGIKDKGDQSSIIEIYVFLITLKYKYPEILKTLLHHKYIYKETFENHQVNIIGENRINISEPINKFISAYREGVLQKTIENVGKSVGNIFDKYLRIDDDYERFGIDNNGNIIINEEIYKYIERKLEFIDYIKKDDKTP